MKQIHNLVFSGKPATQKPTWLDEEWNNPNHIWWHNSPKGVQINSGDIEELYNILTKGYSIKTGIFNVEKGLKYDALLGVQIIGADFDNTEIEPHEVVEKATKLGFRPNMWYYTFSQGIKNKNNFRVLWVLNACVLKSEFPYYFEGLLQIFPDLDAVASDPTRVWFGTSNGGELLHTEFIELSSMPYKEYTKEEKQRKQERYNVLATASEPLDIGDLDWVSYLKDAWPLFRRWCDGSWYLKRHERALLFGQIKALHRGEQNIIQEFFELSNPEIYEKNNSKGYGIAELERMYREESSVSEIYTDKGRTKGLLLPFKENGFLEIEVFTVREFFLQILQNLEQIEPNLEQENTSETQTSFGKRRMEMRSKLTEYEASLYTSDIIPYNKMALGEFYIAIAPTNVGKTWWSMATAIQLARENQKVRLVLTEDDEIYFIQSTGGISDLDPLWDNFDLHIINSSLKQRDLVKLFIDTHAQGYNFIVFDYFKSTMLEDGLNDYTRDLDAMFAPLRDLVKKLNRELTVVATIQGNAKMYDNENGEAMMSVIKSPNTLATQIEGGIHTMRQNQNVFGLYLYNGTRYLIIGKAKYPNNDRIGKVYELVINTKTFSISYYERTPRYEKDGRKTILKLDLPNTTVIPSEKKVIGGWK